jgi:hypothetical protein
MWKNIKSCFLCNNSNQHEEIMKKIQETIDNNHKESLQIIINCIDYVEDKIKEIENKSDSNIIINLRQRSSSI